MSVFNRLFSLGRQTVQPLTPVNEPHQPITLKEVFTHQISTTYIEHPEDV